jgi:hypothetical protein
MLGWLKQKYRDLDWWGVHVEVRGARGIYRASVQGHDQAQGVAQSALAFLKALTEGEVGQAGIWGAEQIVPIDPFLKRLAAHGLIPTIKMIEPAYGRDDHKSWKKNEGV